MSVLTTSDRGKLGAAKRWGNPANRKVTRLDSLTPEQRALVLALVAAAGGGTGLVQPRKKADEHTRAQEPDERPEAA